MAQVYTQLNRYVFPSVIIFGTFGAIANELLFYYRRTLRTTSCALYFRALSGNDFIVLWFCILNLWLAEQFQFDPASYSLLYCKFSQYVTYVSFALSPYLLVLACFDRFCTSSTNARLRKLATVHVAPFLVLITAAIVGILYVFVPIWMEIFSVANQSVCAIFHPQYRKLLAVTLLTVYCFIPPSLMILFCGLTFILLRQQRRRIMPINQARTRHRDNQLLKMLLIYVTTNIICILPFTITYFIQIYIYNNQSPLSDDSVQCCLILVSITYATSFYVYTLGTPFYRDEFKELVKDCWQRIRRNENAVLQRPRTRARNTSTNK